MTRLINQPRGFQPLRVTPWPPDHSVACLTPRPSFHTITGQTIADVLAELASAGYRAVVTAAIPQHEAAPFLHQGFSVKEDLVVLSFPHDQPIATNTNRNVRTRRGRTAHSPRIIEIDTAAFAPGWFLDDAGIKDALEATPRSRLRIAQLDGKIVGFAITGRAGSLGYLQRLAVDPEFQRRGVGQRLVADALEWLERRLVHTTMVNTQRSNTAALQLYHQLGFRDTADRLVILERQL